MADSDSFVEEVTEEVRRDQMFAAWKTYGPFILSAIFALVVGTAAMSWWDGRQTAETRARGEAFIEAQDVDDPAASAAAFKTLSTETDGDVAAMAGLRAGAALGASGDVTAAVEEYERVASLEAADLRLRQLASLRTVAIQADTAEPEALLETLEPLSAPGAPWRIQALEYEAAAHLRADNRQAAVEALKTLHSDAQTPPNTRSRIAEMISALGGEVPEMAPRMVLADPNTPSEADESEGEAN